MTCRRTLLHVAVALLLLLLSFTAAEDSVVAISGQASFEQVVGGADFVVVEFLVPWCSHCQKLAPEYEKAAATLKAEGSTIVLAKVCLQLLQALRLYEYSASLPARHSVPQIVQCYSRERVRRWT